MAGFQPRIAIVGGGPSGLALGLLLARRGIRTTIYELREKPTPEELSRPSGMLDLHEESGLALIRECDLWDDFQAELGDCSESMRIVDSDGNLLRTTPDGGGRPEIPRHALTSLLAQNISEDIIKWNHKIADARSARNPITGATEFTLDLGADGTATYDFVVGADGAWSRVRKLVSDFKPHYSGTQFVTVTLRHASTKYPHLVDLNGPGTLSALGGCNGLLTHRGPQDSIQLYAAVSTPDEDWATTMALKGKTAAEVKATLLGDDKLFRGWASNLQDLLATACDEETKDNPGCEARIEGLYMLPVGYRWEHRTGVTLLGDAAHLMTPFAGEGVNLALWDSMDLAHTLAAVPDAADAAGWHAALEPLIRKFEDTMLERAKRKAQKTARNKDLLMGKNGAQALADMFKGFAKMMAEGRGAPPSD